MKMKLSWVFIVASVVGLAACGGGGGGGGSTPTTFKCMEALK